MSVTALSSPGRARPRRAYARRLRARPGFTMVELIVAIMILTVGLLSLATTAAFVTRQMSSASLQTLAAQISQSRFDSLASVNCHTLAASGATSSGTATSRGITERWTVRDSNDVMFVTDSITYKGRTKPLEYKSVIPCRDI